MTTKKMMTLADLETHIIERELHALRITCSKFFGKWHAVARTSGDIEVTSTACQTLEQAVLDLLEKHDASSAKMTGER